MSEERTGPAKLSQIMQDLDKTLANSKLKDTEPSDIEVIYKSIGGAHMNGEEHNVATIHSLLQHHFDGDERQLKFLFAGLEFNKWKTTAYKQLEHMVLETWHGISTDAVFEDLKVKETGDTLFQKPAIYLWIRFVLQETKTGDFTEEASNLFKIYFEGRDLWTDLSAVTKVHILDINALVGWLDVVKDIWKGKTAKNALEVLAIGKTIAPTIEDPVYLTWAAFVGNFKVEDETYLQYVSNALRNHYGYGDTIKIVMEAYENEHTKQF